MAFCKSVKCRVEIFYLKTKTGNTIPVNAQSMKRYEIEEAKKGIDVIFDNSRHITHFATCVEAKSFRKQKN